VGVLPAGVTIAVAVKVGSGDPAVSSEGSAMRSAVVSVGTTVGDGEGFASRGLEVVRGFFSFLSVRDLHPLSRGKSVRLSRSLSLPSQQAGRL
jgi:hypothetical protein